MSVLALVLLCAPRSLFAQEGVPTAAPKSSASESPAPQPGGRAFSISEVLPRYDALEREIDSIRDQMADATELERIATRLPEHIAEIEEQDVRHRRVLETPSLSDLDGVESDWLAVREPLPEWRLILEKRASAIETAGNRLAELAEVWSMTRREAIASDGPEAILSRIETAIDTIASMRSTIQIARERVLTLQSSVVAQQNRIRSALATVEETRTLLVSRVFERDAEPIWSGSLIASFRGGFSQQIAELLAHERNEFMEFVRRERDRLPLHMAIFVGLAFGLRAARARVRRRTEEELGLGRVAEVFESPLSMSLLLAIVLAPTLYGFIPPFVAQILGAAALVPTILILRRLTPARLLPLLSALVVFYFADRVRELAISLPSLSRSIFLFEMLTGMLVLGWFMRPARLSSLPGWAARTTLLRSLGMAGRFSLGLFAIAFVAEALGFSRLGHLVGGGVLESAYVGVVAYVGVRIVDSLVTFMLRVRPFGLLRMVQRSRELIRRRIKFVLRIAAVAVWGGVTLDLFAIWTPVSRGVATMVTARVSLGSISISLGDVLAFAAVAVSAFLISRLVRFMLEEDVFPRMRLGRGVPYAISTLAHYLILVAGFIMAFAAMGIDPDRFMLLAGAFGVGIGFGLQNIVNNFVSGLILLSERPIQVGDTIETEDTLGEVQRIGIRSSTVRTWSGAELIMPNADLISQRVINWTLSDRQRRIDVGVGVAYGTDRNQVLDLLRKVAEESEHVIADPPPVALFKGFGDSSLDFELRAWTNDLRQLAATKSALAMAIGDAIDDARIEIPFPQRDLHLRSVAEDVAGEIRRRGEGDRSGEPEDSSQSSRSG